MPSLERSSVSTMIKAKKVTWQDSCDNGCPEIVKVQYFESEKPRQLFSPPSTTLESPVSPTTSTLLSSLLPNGYRAATPDHPMFIEQPFKINPVSADENPFRPDGDLSQEADAIVEAIKLGQPLSPTTTSVSYEEQLTRTHVSNDTAAAPPQQANNVNEKVGNDVADAKTKNNVANVTHSQPNVEDGQTVEVQAALVAPASDGNVQVEHVTIEKKKKCCNGCTIL